VRDRPWVGRLASGLGTVTVEGCRFRIDSPLVSDALKSRLLYGRYERTERELLRRHLAPSPPVLELGGGMGVVACVVNGRLVDRTRHVVVEANPLMLPLIRANAEMNGSKFTLVHGAISYGATHVSLHAGEDLLGSQTTRADGGGIGNGSGPALSGSVPVVTLENLIDRYGFDQCTLICDIEGAEIDLVDHECDTLRSHVAMIVIEEHPEYCSAEVRASMFRRLEEAGFEKIETLRKVSVLRLRPGK
jgi:FkbM family methyltransferase